MSTHGERLATLEERSDNLEERTDSLELDIRAIRDDVHEIKEALSNSKGFIGGLICAASFTGAVLGAVATWILHRLFS